jgi:hypothetical protein
MMHNEHMYGWFQINPRLSVSCHAVQETEVSVLSKSNQLVL